MNLCNALRSHGSRDKIKNNVDYSNSNESNGVINSCDRAAHPVTQHHDRTMLTQMISIITKISVRKNKNLATPNSLLSIMSTNGKECIDTFNTIFNNYFESKADIHQIAEALN